MTLLQAFGYAVLTEICVALMCVYAAVMIQGLHDQKWWSYVMTAIVLLVAFTAMFMSIGE